MKSNCAKMMHMVTTLGLAGLYAGCGGVGDGTDGTDGDADSALPATRSQNGITRNGGWGRWGHPWHRSPVTPQGGSSGSDGSGAGGTSSGGTSVGGTSNGGTSNGTPSDTDCSVCAKAQACCEAVTSGPLCSFSEATCESMDGERRQAYVNDCKVLLNTTLSVRTAAPSACL